MAAAFLSGPPERQRPGGALWLREHGFIVADLTVDHLKGDGVVINPIIHQSSGTVAGLTRLVGKAFGVGLGFPRYTKLKKN